MRIMLVGWLSISVSWLLRPFVACEGRLLCRPRGIWYAGMIYGTWYTFYVRGCSFSLFRLLEAEDQGRTFSVTDGRSPALAMGGGV